MTKLERNRVALSTAESWLALCERDLHNAMSSTSWAQYEEYRSDHYTTMLRCEWSGKHEICTLLNIDIHRDLDTLPEDIRDLVNLAGDYSHEAWERFRTFPDYPYRTREEDAE